MFAVQNSVGYTADSLMNLDCLFSTESPLNAGGTDQSFFNAAAATIFVPLGVFILSNLVRTAYVIVSLASSDMPKTKALCPIQRSTMLKAI